MEIHEKIIRSGFQFNEEWQPTVVLRSAQRTCSALHVKPTSSFHTTFEEISWPLLPFAPSSKIWTPALKKTEKISGSALYLCFPERRRAGFFFSF